MITKADVQKRIEMAEMHLHDAIVNQRNHPYGVIDNISRDLERLRLIRAQMEETESGAGS